MVIATAIALWFLPAFLGGLVELVWDTAWMTTTYRSDETWYLGKSQELDHVNNVFSAQGCASVNCSVSRDRVRRSLEAARAQLGHVPQILAVACVPVTEGEIESVERALRTPLCQ